MRQGYVVLWLESFMSLSRASLKSAVKIREARDCLNLSCCSKRVSGMGREGSELEQSLARHMYPSSAGCGCR